MGAGRCQPGKTSFGSVNDFEILSDRPWPIATSSQEPKDPPIRVPDSSQCPDREPSQSLVVLPLPEEFLHQDLSSPSSQLLEEGGEGVASSEETSESSGGTMGRVWYWWLGWHGGRWPLN